MITIRPARPDEAEDLTRIARAAKSHWDYPAAWLAQWEADLTLTPAEIETHLVFTAVTPDDAPLALYMLIDLADKWTLEHFWVHPDSMGQGIGRRLFQHAVAQAVAGGPDTLEIISDPYAAGFYRRMRTRPSGQYTYQMPDGQTRTLPVFVIDTMTP